MAIEALKGKPWYIGLAAGIGVALVLGFLAWWQLLSPMQDRIDGQNTRLADLQSKIQEGRAAKQRLPQFREEVRRLELELEKLLRILPARLNTEDLLRRFRTLAEQGDLDLIRIRPGNLSDRDFYREWPIDLTVEGSYHNLAIFFERLGRFPRIINVDTLRVTARINPGDRGHTIGADFQAKTFVYKEVPADAAGETTGGAP